MYQVTGTFETGTLRGSYLMEQMEKKDSRIIEDKEKGFPDKEMVKGRTRSKSLFQAERPKLTDLDRGVFVISHADFPQRQRSRSFPPHPEKLKPKPTAFDSAKVTKIITDVFESRLGSKSYSAKDCGPAAKELAEIIKKKVAELAEMQFPGYKLACTCAITKRLKPAPVLESGCVWDETRASIENDGFAEYVYRNNDLYALGTVYGVYSKKFETKLSAKSALPSGRRPTPIPE